MRFLGSNRFSCAAALAIAAAVVAGCSGASQSGIPSSQPFGAGPPAAVPASASLSTAQAIGGIPLHVQNYAFWNIDGMATAVPPAWIANWATWVETDRAIHAKAFHAAGGKYALAYVDANYYYASPTYTAPGNYPESAFGHGSNGVRTQRPAGSGTEYYLLPNSAGAQSAFLGLANAIKAGGGFDFVYVDGASSGLGTSLYRMSPSPVEISTDAQYVGGMKQMFAQSPLPVIANGYLNGNPLTEIQDYLGAQNVAGIFGESCFTTYTAPVTDTPYQHHWSDLANALLATTAAHYPAICGGRGTLADNRALRMYYLASWWLTYDPTYSVALEMVSSTSGMDIFPEQALVPRSPTISVSNVATLRWYTGAYLRRFDHCYYMGVSWGACVAVVNPSYSTTVRIPALPVVYHHSLALDNNGLFDGGAASLNTSVPNSLAPGTAAILFQ